MLRRHHAYGARPHAAPLSPLALAGPHGPAAGGEDAGGRSLALPVAAAEAPQVSRCLAGPLPALAAVAAAGDGGAAAAAAAGTRAGAWGAPELLATVHPSLLSLHSAMRLSAGT